MKGKYTVKPCDHGRAKFVVVGYIDGKRKQRFFRTADEAKRHARDMNGWNDKPRELVKQQRETIAILQDLIGELIIYGDPVFANFSFAWTARQYDEDELREIPNKHFTETGWRVVAIMDRLIDEGLMSKATPLEPSEKMRARTIWMMNDGKTVRCPH
jgi:hypothetical protein